MSLQKTILELGGIKKMNKASTLSIRVNEDFKKQLNELCKTWKMNKTQVIEKLVYAEYIRSTEVGKEQIQSVLADLTNLNEKLQRLSNGKEK